jgi:hypothetical protein
MTITVSIQNMPNGAQLQGALLDRAQLQGALLDGAQLQGALLDGVGLQGAALGFAQLQGASLRHTFVWRADARTADTTDARINSVDSGPKQIVRLDVVDWSVDSLNSLKQRIEQEVPEDIRAGALARVERRLNPETPLHEEKQMVEYWDKLQTLSPAPDAYEARLAKQWWQIGCSTEGAPYVLARLIETMNSGYDRFDRLARRRDQRAIDFLRHHPDARIADQPPDLLIARLDWIEPASVATEIAQHCRAERAGARQGADDGDAGRVEKPLQRPMAAQRPGQCLHRAPPAISCGVIGTVHWPEAQAPCVRRITETTHSPQHKLHWLAEQALSWSGLPVVTVRPTVLVVSGKFCKRIW